MSDIQNMETAKQGNGSHEHETMTVKAIWKVFFILLALTALEFFIALALVHRGVLDKGPFVNTVYIVLTIAKAYYIIAYFMHLKFERSGFIICCSVPFILIIYFILLLFNEGSFLHDAFHTYPLWPNK